MHNNPLSASVNDTYISMWRAESCEENITNAAPSGSPSSLTSSSVNTTITFTWLPLPLEQQNGIILQYLVTIYAIPTNETEQLETRETSIVIPNLHPFYLYELQVAAETRAGVGQQSPPVTHQLPEASK